MLAFLLVLLPVSVQTQSCSDSVVSMAIQACTPMYLADLWQSRSYFHISNSKATNITGKDRVCEYFDKMYKCTKEVFYKCPELSRNKTSIIETTVPHLYALKNMCRYPMDACSFGNFKSALDLLPVDKADGVNAARGLVCPRLRVAGDLLRHLFDICSTNDKSRKTIYSVINSRDAVSEPFFKCQDGKPSDPNFIPYRVHNDNGTQQTPDTLFNCYSERLNTTLRNCEVQYSLFVVPEVSRISPWGYYNIDTDIGDHTKECPQNNYYNFHSFSCQKCPEGYDKKVPSRNTNYFCDVCQDCSDSDPDPNDSDSDLNPAPATLASPVLTCLCVGVLAVTSHFL